MRSFILIAAAAIASAAIPVAAQAQNFDPAKAVAAFNAMDSNKDGVLSLEEWTAAGRRERGFRMIDANHDGKVTPAELKAIADRFGSGK